MDKVELCVKFDENLQKVELDMEHQLTPTYPFRLRLVSPESHNIEPKRIHGDPRWAVRYLVKPNGNKLVTIKLAGDPCGSIWIPDATGYPIYGDMKVKRLELKLTFKNLTPFVQLKKDDNLTQRIEEAVGVYQTPIRRLSYEDGEPVTGATPPVMDALEPDVRYLQREGAELTNTFVWHKTGDILPSGYFLGVEWDGLLRER